MISQEKSEQLVQLFQSDPAFAENVFNLSLDEARTAICTAGVEITDDELKSFADMIADVCTTGELTEERLENVAGGALPVAVVGWAISAFKAGYDIGRDLANKHGW